MLGSLVKLRVWSLSRLSHPWHCTDKLIRASSLTLILSSSSLYFLQTGEATSLVVDSKATLNLALLH